MRIRLLSWNVNGIRAIFPKEVERESHLSFSEFLVSDIPDIVGLQETKVDSKKIPIEITRIPGYLFYLNPASRKGYSGTGLYSRIEPVSVENVFHPDFRDEGRIIIARYSLFTLCNVYFPNGGRSPERLEYKIHFYDAFLQFLLKRRDEGERMIICGDVNTAHTEDDLARPKENETVSGFLPIEREWISRLIESNFIDTFRLFSKGNGHYSWWDYKSRARERNVGWRLDYFFVDRSLLDNVVASSIRTEIYGSDHCPVELVLEF